ncbi:MAG: MBL fold metallo-hydrolase [Candidatus Norongarragalinales archaeon]
MATVRFLGHSAFEINLEGRLIYTDPWFSNRLADGTQRIVPSAATTDSVRKADLILVSHLHSDHCDPLEINALVSRTAAQVVAPEDVMSELSIPARCRVPVRVGDNFSLMGVDIEVTQARHPQANYAVGFVCSRGGKSFYFAGDTYDFYEMLNINVDCAMLPIGGTYTMDVLAAIKALKTLRARFVIPMHYNSFPRIRVDVHDFEKRVKAFTKSTPVVLAPGDKFDF